jgi:signal transduction histidine kinase/DNA-binding response OmpR family regulator
MAENRFRYLVLVIFLGSVLLIVYLQFNSGRSIQNLIGSNQQLLKELQVQTQLKELERDLISIESSIRGFVITADSSHLEGVRTEIGEIEGKLESVKLTIGDSSDLMKQLAFLTEEKTEYHHGVLNTYFKHGRSAAILALNANRGKQIRDSISNTINLLSMNRQIQLSGISASIATNGSRAKSWGIFLAIIACVSCMITFWYLIMQANRQQKMITVLDASEKKIKEASMVREQFVANISHEIRTPMNAVLGFTGLLQKTSLDKNQREYVKSIKSSAENLLTIINDILDLSRIESGMLHIEKVPFNLRELLDSLITMLDVRAKSRGLYLKAHVDNDLPQILKGDAVRLTQILMNLISNGVKFTHHGGINVEVRQENKVDDKVYVQFEVTDTGIGIDLEKQRQIFERFQQADAETTRRYGGTGLGLSIVKQLVEIQNGKIELESKPGEGSKFTVTLPYEIATAQEQLTTRQVFMAPDWPVEKIKLLVAEDNPMNRQLLSHLFQHWQLGFDMVENGAQAVEMLRRNSSEYAIVLMDIQMPEMDGYSATDAIRHELMLSIPIIAMTAHALAGEKEKCINSGMDDYISKPLNEEQLYTMITHHARKKSPHVLDMDYLHTISKGDVEFEKSMVKTFTEQMPGELLQLKNAIEEEDGPGMRSIAHNMKSTTSYMGLSGLSQLLEEIEEKSKKKGEIEKIKKNYMMIEETCRLALLEAGSLYRDEVQTETN